MRIFFGIPVTDDMRKSGIQLTNEYKNKPSMKSARWTAGPNLHLTLRFLGECSDEQIEQLCDSTAQLSLPSFEIITNGALLLPIKRPRILALSIRLNDGLAELVRSINQITNSSEFIQEKHPFLPHITVARWKIPPHNLPPIKFHGARRQMVKEFHLYKSESTETGSVYTPIKTFPLTSPSIIN